MNKQVRNLHTPRTTTRQGLCRSCRPLWGHSGRHEWLPPNHQASHGRPPGAVGGFEALARRGALGRRGTAAGLLRQRRYAYRARGDGVACLLRWRRPMPLLWGRRCQRERAAVWVCLSSLLPCHNHKTASAGGRQLSAEDLHRVQSDGEAAYPVTQVHAPPPHGPPPLSRPAIA